MTGWRVVTLGDVIDIFDSKRVPLSSAERADRQGPYPYYGAQGVIDSIDDYIFNGRFILVPEDGENLRSRKLPIAYFADGPFWVNNHAHIIRAKPSVANDRFLQSALEASDIGPFVTGAAQPKLSQANLRRIPLLLPPTNEQEVIADILDVLDDLIENSRRRIELLEQMAQAIYREWFVRFRYPGHEEDDLVDSELGPIPEGWECSSVGAVIELRYGKALKKADRRGGPVAVVGSSGVVGWHDTELIAGPTIVVGRKGNVGSVTWLDGSSWPIDTTYFVATELPLRYVMEQLRRTEFLNTHAAVPGLSRDQAYSRPFLRPPVALMAEFSEVSEVLGSAASVLRASSERLAATRDLLLPKLVTGEIDISGLDLDALVEQATA